jgi:hypothetical protein
MPHHSKKDDDTLEERMPINPTLAQDSAVM